MSTKVHQSGLGQTIGVFADLALLTSFLGVSLGLFEFLGDSFNKKKAASSRIVVGAITFVPPMGFALFYPQGFIMALGYAAIALAILAIFLPIMMVKKARVAEDTQGGYQVFGGTAGLMISGTVGFVIIAAQLLITMGVLPSLG